MNLLLVLKSQIGVDFLKTVKDIGVPILSVLIGALITFYFTIRAKQNERKQRKYSKVRITISNVLLVWKELANFKFLVESEDPKEQVLLQFPKINKELFNLDDELLHELYKKCEGSLEDLSDIDIVLYTNLYSNLRKFDKTIKDIISPSINGNEYGGDYNTELIVSLLEELMHDLQDLIHEVLLHLPIKDRRRVKKAIQKFNEENANINEYEIPIVLIKFLNSISSKLIGSNAKFTEDEVAVFVNNQTVIWIVGKLINDTGLKRRQVIKFAFELFGILSNFDNERLEEEIKKKVAGFDNIKNITISKRENEIFIDNITFYKLICYIIKKINGNVPFYIKREFISINKGEQLVQDIVEEIKADVI